MDSKPASDEEVDHSWRQKVRDSEFRIRCGAFVASTSALILIAVSRGCPPATEEGGGGCDAIVEAGDFDTSKYAWTNFGWLIYLVIASVVVMFYSLAWVVRLYKAHGDRAGFPHEKVTLKHDAFLAVLAILGFIGSAVTTNQYLGDTAASTMDASQGPPALFSPDWATLRCGVAASFFSFFFLALSVYGSAAPKAQSQERLGATKIEQLELVVR